MHSRKKRIIVLSLVVLSLLGVMAAAGATTRGRPIKEFYNSHVKAFFADATTVEFVRPGGTVTVQSAAIASDGTITATFTLADPAGLPLDIAGVTTPGTFSLSFIAGYIPKGQEQYVTYTTRAASGAVVASTQQPGADSGGTTTATATAGQYVYTFKTKAANFDPTVTHTIAIYGSRNLTAYNLGTDYVSTTFNFVPNGSKVVTTRDVINNASCNRCHDQLSFHGGSRRGITMCVMCHTPQGVDPDTGNTLDLKVMAHKIHMGSSLPSVIAGKPYQFIGFNNAVSDFSNVVDPAMAQRCTVCHDQTTKAAQATAYLTNPTRAACGSCHDDVNFATGANHAAGPEPDDTKCAVCHIPQGASDFDASITGAHVVATESSLLSGLNATIKSVTGSAGSKPVVTFQLKDSKGNGVLPSALSSLSLTMAGPTTDYGYTSFGADVTTTPGYVTESATKASCAADGTCVYTFTHAVPAGATGTYAIGLEGRRSETILSGTPKQQTVQYGAANPVSYFSVDGSTVAPRRSVVALANCNQCHVNLSLHGTLRNNTAYCVMCHNPSNTDFTVRSAATNATDKALPNQGINFNLLVHRTHFGPNAAADGTKNPYVVVGFGGSHNDLSQTLYPPFSPTGSAGDTRNCSICHVSSSEQTLPIGKNPVVDPQGWLNPTQATAGACSGCHTSVAEASHFLGNTTILGESCTVCHSSGAAYAVNQVHAQY
ncbi:MAG TPA: OmcA/MtrC family decaheme c-type cytochrome [Bryobacteraceae bacterium]|jgi:OmcA/MtrC family decaheme c-type cytochrome|nr:OmcA/MtrC family decaheme c-type cytochrome [Bryobacteraceae bacterium]